MSEQAIDGRQTTQLGEGWLTDSENEWWQRARASIAARMQRGGILARLARWRAAGLWLCLAWVLVLATWHSEFREPLKIALQTYWLLIAWFWMARTKTLSWSFVAGLYSVCITWAIGVAFVTHRLAIRATEIGNGQVSFGGNVDALGPSTMIAGIGEECAKLLPVAVIALFAAARARRFAVTDWLLLGFASGLGFQTAEELARRTAVHVTKPGLFDILLGTVNDRSPASGFAQYGLSPLGGWSQWAPGTQFPGHHATTALVTGCVGLGLATWRSRTTQPTALAWRAAALLAPLVMLWLVISVHAGGNASGAVGDKWLTAENPSMPWLIRAGWQVSHHGVGLRWLLLFLLLLALVVDGRALRRGDATPSGPVLAIPFSPTLVGQRWTTQLLARKQFGDVRITSRPSRVIDSVTVTAAYLWRDLQLLAAAHIPAAGQSRRAAVVQSRVVMEMLRSARAEGIARCVGPSNSSLRTRARWGAATVLSLLLIAIFVIAPYAARQVGLTPMAIAPLHDVPSLLEADWFARLLDALGQWWSSLSPAEQIAIGIGIAALVALSGGSFGLALGISGAATYLASHASGAATFVTDPRAATRDYLSHTSPLGVAADVGEGVLTFLPGNFAGAATGTLVRNGARSYLRDPQAWWAVQRAARFDERGIIDLAAFYRRDPIELADGTLWKALSPDEQAAMRQWWEELPVSKLNASGAAGEYQVRLYGDSERILTHSPKKVIADGSTLEYGAVSDAKYRVKANSWHDPASMGSAQMTEIAAADMDLRLKKYAAVLNDPTNPAKVLEISTNDAAVAAFVESRMQALGIAGYVRLEP